MLLILMFWGTGSSSISAMPLSRDLFPERCNETDRDVGRKNRNRELFVLFCQPESVENGLLAIYTHLK